MKISVCMATFNGESFIRAQVDSCLCQLREHDEIIIVDDCSTDLTASIIESYCDSRIILFRNSYNRGHVHAFETALRASKGEIIFLCDQDDIWIPNKIETVVKEFQLSSEVVLVASNFELIDHHGERLPQSLKSFERDTYSGISGILGILTSRLSYWGCTMAFRAELLQSALPFPEKLESHDVWIALVARFNGMTRHLCESLVLRRIHEKNVTPRNPRPFFIRIKRRVTLIKALLQWLCVTILRSSLKLS